MFWANVENCVVSLSQTVSWSRFQIGSGVKTGRVGPSQENNSPLEARVETVLLADDFDNFRKPAYPPANVIGCSSS